MSDHTPTELNIPVRRSWLRPAVAMAVVASFAGGAVAVRAASGETTQPGATAQRSIALQTTSTTAPPRRTTGDSSATRGICDERLDTAPRRAPTSWKRYSPAFPNAVQYEIAVPDGWTTNETADALTMYPEGSEDVAVLVHAVRVPGGGFEAAQLAAKAMADVMGSIEDAGEVDVNGVRGCRALVHSPVGPMAVTSVATGDAVVTVIVGGSPDADPSEVEDAETAGSSLRVTP